MRLPCTRPAVTNAASARDQIPLDIGLDVHSAAESVQVAGHRGAALTHGLSDLWIRRRARRARARRAQGFIAPKPLTRQPPAEVPRRGVRSRARPPSTF